MSTPEDSKASRRHLDGMLENVIRQTDFIGSDKTDEEIAEMETVSDAELDKMMSALDQIAPEEKQGQKAMRLQTPDVNITVDDSRMSAHLSISIPKGPVKRVDKEAVITAMKGAGIIHGIDSAKIDKVIADAEETHSAEILAVIGTAPERGADGEIVWLIPTPKDKLNREEKIIQGKMIAKKVPPRPGIPGTDIYGKEVSAETGAEAEFPVDRGIKFDNKISCYVTEIEGHIYFKDEKVTVEPVKVAHDAAFWIDIVEDGKIAQISITPAGEDGAKVTLDQVSDYIKEREIGGVDEKLLAELVEKAAGGEEVLTQQIAESEPINVEVILADDVSHAKLRINIPEKTVKRPTAETLKELAMAKIQAMSINTGFSEAKVNEITKLAGKKAMAEGVIATGIEVEHGNDAELRWLVRKPVEGGEPVLVSMGKMMVKLKPPTFGKPGMTVTGHEIPPKPGSESNLTRGRGVMFDRKNLCWYAKEEGRLSFRGMLIEILPHRNADFGIEIDPSGLSASLSIRPSKGAGRKVTLEEVLAEIENQGIRRFEMDLVKEMVERAAEGIEISAGVIATGEPAYIETSIDSRAMEVRVKVELPGEPIRDLPEVFLKKEILSALEDADIVYGIEDASIDAVVAAACKQGSGEGAVARGTQPNSGTDGSVEWIVDDPTKDAAVVIAPGKVIARAMPPGRGTPGTTVTGIEIPPRPGLEPRMTIGRGVNFDRRRQIWYSAEAVAGRVIVADGRLTIVPHSDAYFSVNVNNTGTQAFLTIMPGKGQGLQITLEAVLEEINKQGILEYDEAILSEAVQSASQGASINNKPFAETTAPQIKITVSEDLLEATLEIALSDKPVQKPDPSVIGCMIKEGLADALVVRGVDQDMIDALIEKATNEFNAKDVVALGIPAEDGGDAVLEWMVEEPKADNIVLVAAGKLIARLKEGEKGKPGQTVTGETLTPKPGTVPSIGCGPGIVHDRKRGSWAAKASGRLTFKDTRLSISQHADMFFEISVEPSGLAAQIAVVPGRGDGKKVTLEEVLAEIEKQEILKFDEAVLKEVLERAATGVAAPGVVFARSDPPFVTTAIAANAMEAHATIELDENPVKPMPLEILTATIEDALKQSGVITGIDKEELMAFAKKAQVERRNEGAIAKGTEPENGTDGSIEWTVEEPQEGKDVFVAAGKMLAKAIPATRGNPGETVTGIPLPAKPGAAARLAYGKGVKYEGGRQAWWSNNSGKLVLKGGRLQIFSHSEGSFEVFFDATGRQAFLSLKPPKGDAKGALLEDVLAEIADKDILNFNRPVVEELVAKAASGVEIMSTVIAESEPPELQVFVAADRMEARLRIAMPKAPIKLIEPSVLIALANEQLAQKKVRAGIDNVRLTALVNNAIAENQAEDIVAIGTAPEHGEDGEIEWKVPNPQENEEVLVAQGKIIAIAKSPGAGTGGQSVTGDPIPAKPGRDPHMTIAQGIVYVPAKRQWIAEKNGKLFFKDHTIFIAGHGDGSFSVQVDKDGMNARLTIIPPEGEGKLITLDEVLAGIEKKGVTEFDKTMVEQAVERIELGETVDEIIIAQGTEPRSGKDGYLEYLVEQPKAKRGVPSLIAINAGQVFAEIYPAQKGTAGKNVLGKEVPPPPVKEAEIELGEGVDVDEPVYAEGKGGKKTLVGGKIKAASDGNLLIRGLLVEVRKILKFDHDLTAAMGNVDFDGHVVIEGNVSDNVQVKTAGDIYVQKGVAAAYLTAGGNIEIGGGIAGRDRGIVQSKGSVVVQFVERGKIMAAKDIKVANAVLHAQLYAGDSIDITEGKGMFIGGKATAGGIVRARTIGSGTGTPTSVNVGIDPFVEIEVIDLDKQLIALRNAIRELQPAIDEITQLLQKEKSAVLLLKFRELTRRKVMIPIEMKQHLKRREEIFQRLYPDRESFIEAFDQLHLGVSVMVGKEQLVLQAPVVLARIKTGANGVYSVPIRDADLGRAKVGQNEKGLDIAREDVP